MTATIDDVRTAAGSLRDALYSLADSQGPDSATFAGLHGSVNDALQDLAGGGAGDFDRALGKVKAASKAVGAYRPNRLGSIETVNAAVYDAVNALRALAGAHA